MLTGPLAAVVGEVPATVVGVGPSADARGGLPVLLLLQAEARTATEARRVDRTLRRTGTAQFLPTATTVLEEKVGAGAALTFVPQTGRVPMMLARSITRTEGQESLHA